MTRLNRLSLTLLLAALILVAGCGVPLKPMQMNNRIARANLKLSTAARKFYKGVEPIRSGGAPDSSLSTYYAECGSALRDARNDFEGVLPPPGSAAGVTLLEKYRTFLAQQQVVYDTAITPIFNAAQDSRLDAFGKWQTIAPLLSKASSEENRAMSELRSAHQEFCKYHNFEAK